MAELQNIDPGDLDSRQQSAFEILREVCQASGLEIQPEIRSIHAPYIDIDLVGTDAEESFGKFGKRLDSLQYLCNLVITRKIGPDVRVVLDAAGYRENRTKVLEELAREYAAQVRERQEECELDPLPAHERRIIHNILSSEEGIRTWSEGEDPDRRVVIGPA